MTDVYFGLILGVFLGLGLTVRYLALSDRSVPIRSELWIDEAFQRAFVEVKKPNR